MYSSRELLMFKLTALWLFLGAAVAFGQQVHNVYEWSQRTDDECPSIYQYPGIEYTIQMNTHTLIGIAVPHGEVRIFDVYEGDIMYSGHIVIDDLYYTFSGLYSNDNDSDIIITLEHIFLHVFDNGDLPYDVDHRMSKEGMTEEEWNQD